MARIYLKSGLCVLYTVLLIAAAPTILWGLRGAIWGLALGIAFLACLFWEAEKKIARVMQAGHPRAEEVRVPLHLLSEHARRLGLPVPRLLLIPSDGMNAAIFGWSRGRATIVLTEGILQGLSREELSSLLALLLTKIWFGEFTGQTLLARLLRILEVLSGPFKKTGATRQSYPLRLLIRQSLLYPLALPAIWLVGAPASETKTDLLSVKIGRHPAELASGLRKIDVAFAGQRQTCPFSIRHLFLVFPHAEDPLANLFFSPQSLLPRIRQLESGLCS